MAEREVKWAAAVAAFDRHHGDDPRAVTRDGGTTTWSRDYHARVLAWVDRLDAHAPVHVRLAALCQHLRRWESPREAYPEGVEGYKRWRAAAGLRQAELATRELAAVGYDDETIARTKDVLLKKKLKHDPDAALLEDAVCLRFVEDELVDFARGREHAALLGIVRKTWDKMSARGRTAALALVSAAPPRLPAEIAALLAEAVAEG
ncbi:MAG TPA: DUF4202 domain-containing protein [Nannocystaceae bacterium]|nr:DUF4202 domain-containing protein [Nannocystaceae bacterium]